MPQFNGTGPMGMGPRTGWGMGPCCGGFGRGRGYSMGRGYQMTGEEKKQMLKDQAEYLKADLLEIEKELLGLEK